MSTGLGEEPTAATRAVMRGNTSRDTKPEVAVRRELHRQGLRYRVDVPVSVGGKRRTIDVAFPRQHVAVLIDGCFWHGCPEHYRPATGRTSSFWSRKIDRNRERDLETTELLTSAGWTVLRFWEHDHVVEVARVIGEVLRPAEPQNVPRR